MADPTPRPPSLEQRVHDLEAAVALIADLLAQASPRALALMHLLHDKGLLDRGEAAACPRTIGRALMAEEQSESLPSPQDFDSYLTAQAHNLAEVRRLPEFQFVERIVALYERSLVIHRRDPDVRLLQLFIVCHGALLSAAATIGRALPGDAIAVTRRAVEAASLAAAFKADPRNYERWLDPDARLQRWEERNKGLKPKGRAGRGIKYPETVARLRSHAGMLSDPGIHLTPEFISKQRLRTERREGTRALLRFIYFETEQRELERDVMLLAAIHLDILEIFAGVFDDAFQRDAEWVRLRGDIGERGIVLAARFQLGSEISPRPAGAGERGRGTGAG